MQRRHDIDALRVIAFSLLILYHSAMVYVADWDFHIKSAYQLEWLQYPMIALNRWRMALLFMISGIALGLARIEDRRWHFAKARSLRLLLPLLFGMFLVVAPQAYFEGRASGHLPAGFPDFLLRYWQVRPWPKGSFTGWEHGITWNHLWYLAYLLPYTLLLLVAIPLLRRLHGWLQNPAHLRLSTGLLLGLPILWLLGVRLWLGPHFQDTHALFDDWTVHAESLPLFLLGYVLATNSGFWDWAQRLRWRTLTVAALAIGVELGLRWLGRHPPTGPIPEWALHVPWYLIERIARATYTWMALLAIFGWGRTLVDRPLLWLPYCSEAVFPWYILHQTLIVALAYWLIPLRLGAGIEATLLVLGTIAGCLLLHECLIRRIDWLRPLFGLRREPKARDGFSQPRSLEERDHHVHREDGVKEAP